MEGSQRLADGQAADSAFEMEVNLAVCAVVIARLPGALLAETVVAAADPLKARRDSNVPQPAFPLNANRRTFWQINRDRTHTAIHIQTERCAVGDAEPHFAHAAVNIDAVGYPPPTADSGPSGPRRC